MRALGCVLVGVMWIVCLVATVNIALDWVADQRIKRALKAVDVIRIPWLAVNGTMRRMK